ncbi:hypothetical protein ACKLNO_11140 [Neisseriaceae bacterium B1]
MKPCSQSAPIQGVKPQKTSLKQTHTKPTSAKSGFHTWQPEHHAPSIQAIVMQIKRDYGVDYQAKRSHIHDCFKREYNRYRELYDTPAAREMAAFNAQYRVDSLLNAYHDNAAKEQRIEAAIKARFQEREAKRAASKAAKQVKGAKP